MATAEELMKSYKTSTTTIPAYEAQTDAVNKTYDAAANAQTTALKAAYESSRQQAEQSMAAIPETYQQQANATAAQAERSKAAFNEYAAANGLNSGAGGQAALAQQNQLAGDLGAIRTAQANAQREAENNLANMYTKYQGDVATALANNEYDRANQLMSEYRRAAEGAVTSATTNAQMQYQKEQDELARQDAAEKFAYQKQLDEINRQMTADNLAYQRQQDALDRETAAQQFAYQQQQNELNRQLNAQGTAYDQALAQAKTLAGYGDFSGYAALGYTPEQIAAMSAVWRAQNPELAAAMGGAGSAGSTGSGSVYGPYEGGPGGQTTENVKIGNPTVLPADPTNGEINWNLWRGNGRSFATNLSGNGQAVKSALENMRNSGKSRDEMKAALIEARNSNIISSPEWNTLYSEYALAGGNGGR